jgi:hypothetical protein
VGRFLFIYFLYCFSLRWLRLKWVFFGVADTGKFGQLGVKNHREILYEAVGRASGAFVSGRQFQHRGVGRYKLLDHR